MPIQVNKVPGTDQSYSTPFRNGPTDKVTVSLDAGAIATSVAEIVDSNGVVRPGACFVQNAAGKYIPLPETSKEENVTGADTTANTLTVSGDYTTDVDVGDLIAVTGSSGNDGTYLVLDISGGTSTTFTVDNVPDGTADGKVLIAEHYEFIGLVPYSIKLFSDNLAATLSAHGAMDLVVGITGSVWMESLEKMLGRSLAFEEEAAIKQSPGLQLVKPAA